MAVLLITLAALARFLAVSPRPIPTDAAAPFLVLFTVLFVLRVVGQLFVRAYQPSWLPPTEQWNLSPYAVLLPTQIALLVLMGWIDLNFQRGHGFWTQPRPGLGSGVLWLAAVYAAAMVIRYVVRMRRWSAERWFGGTIPIVFHWVLASYLLVFGLFHASH